MRRRGPHAPFGDRPALVVERTIGLKPDAVLAGTRTKALGSNTSIQDSYNLVWKLGLVLSGLADDSLLDSYDDERQPVGRQVVDRANQSVGEMLSWLGPIGLRPGQSDEEAWAVLDGIFGPDGEATRQELLAGLEVMNGQFNAHGVELGQRYVSQVAVDDGTPRQGCVLVRPDRFVAWRSQANGGDPSADLLAAMRALLGR